MYILGISAYYHDAGVALIEDDYIVAAVQEERFTRKKHDDTFPVESIKYCLKEANIRCNIYTSPHVKCINERFVYNDEMISDDALSDLLNEIEEINNGQSLTYFEALTAAFFLGCKKYKKNLVIAEFGLRYSYYQRYCNKI